MVFLFVYVISSGDIVCLFIGVRFGKCIWLEFGVNIYNVLIIKIDFFMINFLRRIVFDEYIIIDEILK